MKKPNNGLVSLAFLALLLVAVALAGCDEDRDVDSLAPLQDEAGTQETAAAEPTPPTPADAPQEDAVGAVVDPPAASPQPEETPPSYVIDGVIEDGEYARTMSLARMEVHWSNDADTLRMALDAPAEGYVTVGFDPVSRKVGANYIIGYVKDGEAVVRDHVGTRGNLHEWDIDVGGEDNLLAYAGTEADGRTVIEFIIPLDSGDPKDRPLSPGMTYVIQVAYQSRRDDFTSWHSRHGTSTIELESAP